MKKLHYCITVRDKNGKLYETDKGYGVQDFRFEDKETDEKFVRLICLDTFENYKAICKEGSDIEIEVRYFNEIANTYAVLYTFYGATNKFIKH